LIHGEWVDCLIDINRTPTEFSADDVDRYSELVDLGRAFEKLVIIVPATVTASELLIYVQELASTATVPTLLHVVNTDTAYTVTLAASTCFTCDCITGIRYLRLYSATNQAQDVTFRIRGVRS